MRITDEYQLLSQFDKRVLLTLQNKKASDGDENGHCHPNMEIILVNGGKGAIKINNNSIIDVENGDVLIFDSMQSHQLLYVESEEEFSVLSIEFNIRNFVTDEFKVFGKKDVDRFFVKRYNSDCIISGGTEEAENIKELILAMLKKLQRDKQPIHVIRAQMLLIFTLVLEYYDQNHNADRVRKPNQNTHIEKTIIYINQHINERLTLEELAGVANMGKSYYSTIFKKVTGQTVWEYILNMRIELAISYMMMNESKYNISEIAQLCGFNNVANFNKAFKKLVGTAPRDYKKSKDSSCFSK